jgi:hypothetical protein
MFDYKDRYSNIYFIVNGLDTIWYILEGQPIEGVY